MIQADSGSQGWSQRGRGAVQSRTGGRGGLGHLGYLRCEEVFGEGGGQREKGESGSLQVAAEEEGEQKRSGLFLRFGSEVGVVVALARHASAVPSLSVPMPLVLPALPPALVVMAPVTVGSPG